ncbi:MAG: MMPL family transporter [Candidatus Omnitrophota bacterium]|nr:MMPL family transporter [Candidatus Omnitrophota bacterium]
MSLIRLIAKLIVRFPRTNLLILAIVTLLFGWALAHLEFDTSLSAFVIRNDPDMLYYNKIKELFETDETVVIGFKGGSLFSKEDLTFIKNLSKKIEEIDFVRNVKSLSTANLITTTPDMFQVKALMEKIPQSRQESDIIRIHAITNYLYVKDLASADGKFYSLLVDIKSDPKKQRTNEVVKKIKTILLKENAHRKYKLYLAGDAIINHSLGEYMQRDFFVFIIPIYLIITALMRLTMGRWRDTIAALLVITLSLIWSMGAIAVMGKTFNNVTIGIIPLIFCIALENIYYIHDIYYRQLRRTYPDRRGAFREALILIFGPCFFASFTTVIGFASLMVNNIKPIVDFGILGSIAATLAFIISLILIPSFHILLKTLPDLQKKPVLKINAAPLIAAIIRFIERRRRWFWVGLPLLIIFCIAGILRIRAETDHLEFFHKNSEVRQATVFIEKNIAGVSNLEITVDTHIADTIKEPTVLRQIDMLTTFVRQQPKVDKAVSIVDFLKDMNRAMHDNDQAYYRLPETREMVAQYLLLYSMSPRRNDVEKDFVDYPYRLARIRCRISEHNSVETIKLVNRIKKFSEDRLDPALEIKITSYPVIYSNMVNSITTGQIKDLLFVGLTLLLAAIIYFRSLKLGVLTMIPNVIPTLCTFGFMGWAGITLNVGTALTAGIALGLAMDDTTHFLNRFKIEQAQHPDYLENTRHTLSLLGEPMMFSSYVMIASYLVLLFSQFRLTMLFGFLCALTTFVALCCDLLITPWILITFKPKIK